jgi:CheY-like chemotaxis protein
MLSSSGVSGDAARCRALNVAAYLTKPIKQSELLEAILKALRSWVERPRPAPRAPSAEGGEGRPLRILLVEDNVINQKLATIVLERAGHRVAVARSGKEALAVLGLGEGGPAGKIGPPFDLVLMDVQMPELDGYEATTAIRDEERRTGRHLPILALTAYAMKGDRERCLGAGMDGYLAKPIQEQDLWRAIRDLVPGAATPRPGRGNQGAAGPSRKDEAVDREALLARVRGQTPLLAEIVRLLLDDIGPRSLQEIGAAIANADRARLRRAAHTLKGALGNLCAAPACQAARRLEVLGREGDLTTADEAYRALCEEMERLSKELAELVKAPHSP